MKKIVITHIKDHRLEEIGLCVGQVVWLLQKNPLIIKVNHYSKLCLRDLIEYEYQQ